MSNESKILFTDGEGPLVVKDLARDIATKRVSPMYFDALSLWVAFKSERSDGVLEPGDTLSLLVPHLLCHNISDEDLETESRNTHFAKGVKDWVSILLQDGWEFRVISTSYQHLWDVMGYRLGIPRKAIASTRINLELVRKFCWSNELSKLTTQTENFITMMNQEIEGAVQAFRSGQSLEEVFGSGSMQQISTRFEDFYFRRLPDARFRPLREVSVLNGFRKVEAMFKFAEELDFDGYNEVVYIGDSITDDATLTFIRENGGLAIALNADRFAIRNANVAVALEDRRDLMPILEAWSRSGMEGIKPFTEGQGLYMGKERIVSVEGQSRRVDFVTQERIGEIVETHTEYRQKDKALPSLL